MFVNGYVVDGHVPMNTVRKLLSEKPAIAGIALPGMPLGSPGMGGTKEAPFTIYAITKDGAEPEHLCDGMRAPQSQYAPCSASHCLLPRLVKCPRLPYGIKSRAFGHS